MASVPTTSHDAHGSAIVPNAVVRPSTHLAGCAAAFRLSWSAVGIIVVVGLVVLLTGLGSARVLTYHEVVYAEPAREMLATGNFILPKIAGVPFTDKPPLGAWTIALSMAVFQSEAEWVVRLPSVLAAIGTALILASVAARWFGNRIGLIAGLMQLTMVHVSMQARLAEADTLLALTVAGAMALFGLAQVESPHRGKLRGRWVPWAFHACLGFAFLAKFMAGIAFVVAACGLFLLITRDYRAILRFCFDPVGVVIFLLLTVPWLAAAYREYPVWLDNVLFHNFGRFGSSLGLNEPGWAYWYQIPAMTLPWSPLAMWGVAQGVRRGLHHDARWQWLGCWFLGGLTILSLMAFKTKHYPIPILTPLAIAAAWGWYDLVSLRARLPRAAYAAGIILAVVGASVAILILDRSSARSLAERRELQLIVGVIAAGASAVLVMGWLRRPRLQTVGAIALAGCASLLVQFRVMPFHDSYRHQTVFAQEVNAKSRISTGHVTLVGLPDNQITFYLKGELSRFDEPGSYFAQVETVKPSDAQPELVLGPAWLAAELQTRGKVALQLPCEQWNRYQTERDKLTLFAWRPQGELTQVVPTDKKIIRK